MTAERRFPIIGAPSIPWLLIAPHAEQARANHGQTLEQLAERGGLDRSELWCVVHGRRLREAPEPMITHAWFREWLDAGDGYRAHCDELHACLELAMAKWISLSGNRVWGAQESEDRRRCATALGPEAMRRITVGYEHVGPTRKA